jgi:hypothetical protein
VVVSVATENHPAVVDRVLDRLPAARRSGSSWSALRDECAPTRRDLGEAARAELERLLTMGTAEEIERVLRDLPPAVNADEVHADSNVTAAFAAARRAWQRRAEQHRRRVVALGRRFGADVAAHTVALEDAEWRLDALAFALDETVPVALGILPPHVAREIARAAFEEGFGNVAA